MASAPRVYEKVHNGVEQMMTARGGLTEKLYRWALKNCGAVFEADHGAGTAGALTLAVVVGLMLHALMYGPQAAFFSELFGTSVRYTGASVGYQLASILAGAIAPIVALRLLGSADGGAAGANTTAVGIYIAITSLLTVIAVLAVKETRNTSLRHDRVVEGAHD